MDINGGFVLTLDPSHSHARLVFVSEMSAHPAPPLNSSSTHGHQSSEIGPSSSEQGGPVATSGHKWWACAYVGQTESHTWHVLVSGKCPPAHPHSIVVAGTRNVRPPAPLDNSSTMAINLRNRPPLFVCGKVSKGSIECKEMNE